MWLVQRCVLLPLDAYAYDCRSLRMRLLLVPGFFLCARASRVPGVGDAGVRACVDDGVGVGVSDEVAGETSSACEVSTCSGSTCKESLTLVVANGVRGGCSQRRGSCADQSIGSVTPAKRPPQNSRAPDRSVTTRA